MDHPPNLFYYTLRLLVPTRPTNPTLRKPTHTLSHRCLLRRIYCKYPPPPPCSVLTTLQAIVVSCYVLRIQQPPSIRLVDTQSHRFDKSRSGTPLPEGARAQTPKTPTLSEHDALLALSLSNKPVITRPSHVFGLPSMQGAPSPQAQTPARPQPGADDMDWTPTHAEQPAAASAFGQPQQRSGANEDDGWLRPQRFFAPEKPTGLEGLFESAHIQDEPMLMQRPDTPTRTSRLSSHLWKWGPFYTLFIALAVTSATYTARWVGVMLIQRSSQ